MDRAIEEAHHQLIDQIIALGSLWSKPLLVAFRATPRHHFLSRIFVPGRAGAWQEMRLTRHGTQELRHIYSDHAVTTRLSQGHPPIPISSSSQPSLMAQMLEDLQLRAGLRVLEIGAGTGYNAALLGHVVGPVVSVDVDAEVLHEAALHLRELPDRDITLKWGDGRSRDFLASLPGAPFDRLQVTAATPDLEPAWFHALAEGGILQAPWSLFPGLGLLIQVERHGAVLSGHLTRPAYFMVLRNTNDPASEMENSYESGLPPPETLDSFQPPWMAWAERGALNEQRDFLPSLAFLGWLDGLSVAYHEGPDGRPMFGLGDRKLGLTCWLGRFDWRSTGDAGRSLGFRLWQTFLEMGGPRPQEFRLLAGFSGDFPRPPNEARLVRHRHGDGSWQTWYLPQTWDRPD